LKRLDLVRHIEKQGCKFLKEGSKHTLYINPVKNKISSIPRHKEVKNNLCKKICKDLEVSSPL